MAERDSPSTYLQYDPDRVDRIVHGFAEGGSVRAGDGLPDPSLINLPLYARTVSEEMFPDERDNPKRDAARHMLAAAIAAQKTSPGIAEFLGKAYEFKEAPLRTAGYFLGLSEPRSDYHTDLHNNAIGVQLGKDNRTLRAMLDAVERETNRGTPTAQPGRASLKPDAVSKYTEGGTVDSGETYGPSMEFEKDPDALRAYKREMKQLSVDKKDSSSNVSAGLQARVADDLLPPARGMAAGGYVAYDPQQVDRIVHGFAEGGSVIKNAAIDFMKFLDDQGLSMSDVVAAFGKRGLPLSAAFYSGGLNTDEDLELRKRRKQKPTIDEPKFAQGGSVSAYDPSRVDAIVNEFM